MRAPAAQRPGGLFLTLRHRETFRRKWARELAACEPAAPTEPRAVARAVAKGRGSRHLLLIDDRPPQRGSGSGFSVLLDAIEELADTGCAVTVAVSDRRTATSSLLAELGVQVACARPRTPCLADWEGRFERVLISRPNNFARYAPVVRRHQPQASLTYLAEALFYRRMQRQLDLVSDPAATGAAGRRRCSSRVSSNARFRWKQTRSSVSRMRRQPSSRLCRGIAEIEVVRPIVRGLAPTAGALLRTVRSLVHSGMAGRRRQPECGCARSGSSRKCCRGCSTFVPIFGFV